MRPFIPASISSVLGEDGWSLGIEARADGRQADLRFNYPKALATEEYGNIAYVPSSVLIEIGATSDHEPSERISVRSYAAEQFPDMFAEPEAKVRVLSPLRTFWEKATLLHAECGRPNRGEQPPAWQRISRHASELVMLDRAGRAEEALGRLDILERVVTHKKIFYASAWAAYEDARAGSFRLVPEGALFTAMEEDYERMRPMFFGAPIEFPELIEGLSDLQKRINGGGS